MKKNSELKDEWKLSLDEVLNTYSKKDYTIIESTRDWLLVEVNGEREWMSKEDFNDLQD
jgi:hypothetical protein